MMGRKDGQMRMIMVSMEDMIPENHLLRKIDEMVEFQFIYQLMAEYYSDRGRPSIDPICMIKMLLIGYLYGIRSERRLEEEVTLNIAYRWFCGYDLMDRIPDHSTFSQNRRRCFTDDGIFRKIFNQLVKQCMEKGLVGGEQVVSDGSFVPGNVSWDSRYEVTVLVEKSTVDYLDALNEELSQTPGYVKPTPVVKEKQEIKSDTDPDCGYIVSVQQAMICFIYLCCLSPPTRAVFLVYGHCYCSLTLYLMPTMKLGTVKKVSHFRKQGW